MTDHDEPHEWQAFSHPATWTSSSTPSRAYADGVRSPFDSESVSGPSVTFREFSLWNLMESVHRKTYVLPDIQRRFVWDSPDDTIMLLDSIMRDYPIGSLLLWEVPETPDARPDFYDFIHVYDRDAGDDAPISESRRGIVAVLDGQQRLTSLFIALTGYWNIRKKNARRSDPGSYERRYFYFCPTRENSEPDPEEPKYVFALLSEAGAEKRNDDRSSGDYWLALQEIASHGPNDDSWERHLPRDIDRQDVRERVRLLRNKLRVSDYKPFKAHVVSTESLDDVLDIFIRTNRQGRKLTPSDLLVSVATRSWEGNARQEIYGLLEQLNGTGEGFSFAHDRVLKAGLLIATNTLKLNVSAMKAPMRQVEERWEDVSRDLRNAAELLAMFGFSAKSLSADNTLVFVAFYLARRGLTQSFLTAKGASAIDREELRQWIVRSLLRGGFWTGAVDSVFVALRAALDNTSKGFPGEALELELNSRGKSLAFTTNDLDAILETNYASKTVVSALTLLYPGTVEHRSVLHADHVFPREAFKLGPLRKALEEAGRDPEDAHLWRLRSEQLPNLQPLTAAENLEKSDKRPGPWIDDLPENRRRWFTDMADLGDELPGDLTTFFAWFEARHERQRDALTRLLRIGR